MARQTIAILLPVACAFGCKGETVYKPDPDMERALKVCQDTLAEKNKLNQALTDENMRMMNKGTGSEITVAFEGTLLTVKPAKPGETRPVDDKVVAAASKGFEDLVQKSRGAIQKCYEQVLKKDTNLQSTTVTLTVQATFSGQGAYQGSAFHSTKDLGGKFDDCMKTIAEKWTLPANSQTMTFKAQVSLTPS